jgi:hypothetical protein
MPDLVQLVYHKYSKFRHDFLAPLFVPGLFSATSFAVVTWIPFAQWQDDPRLKPQPENERCQQMNTFPVGEHAMIRENCFGYAFVELGAKQRQMLSVRPVH